jgi:hypothetical protein
MTRLLLIVTLLLALACPSQAQTSRYVGTWLSGSSGSDWTKVLRLTIRDRSGVGWGTAMDKNYMPYLQVRKINESSTFAMVSGSWEDSTQVVALFALGQASCLAPSSGSTDFYAYLVMERTGDHGYLAADDNAQPFRFRLQRIP